MTIFFVCLAWWAIGFGSFIALRRECMTWGELIFIGGIAFGAFGPLTAVIVGIMLICSLDFWHRDVCDTFRRKRQ